MPSATPSQKDQIYKQQDTELTNPTSKRSLSYNGVPPRFGDSGLKFKACPCGNKGRWTVGRKIIIGTKTLDLSMCMMRQAIHI